MSQTMQIPLAARLDRLARWFKRENERPLLGFYIGSQYPLHCYPGCRKHLPNGVVQLEDVVVTDFLADSDRQFELYERTGGDLIWSASPFCGLPWVEATLGCTVIADHAVGSTRTSPPARFAAHPVIPEFSANNPWFQKLLEFFPVLEARSAGRYMVGVTLMRGISDLLSALYGGENFLFHMIDTPEKVKEVAERLTDYWIKFGQAMLEHTPSAHGGTAAFFYSIWCPGRTIWMQEDAAALLSPELYEQFILPCNRRIAGAFEHTVMHLHPTRFNPVDYLLEMGIDVIEMHIDKGGPTAEQLFQTHLKVLARKPLLIWGDLSEADLDFVLANLPHPGLAISVVVESPEQAARYWGKLANARK